MEDRENVQYKTNASSFSIHSKCISNSLLSSEQQNTKYQKLKNFCQTKGGSSDFNGYKRAKCVVLSQQMQKKLLESNAWVGLDELSLQAIRETRNSIVVLSQSQKCAGQIAREHQVSSLPVGFRSKLISHAFFLSKENVSTESNSWESYQNLLCSEKKQYRNIFVPLLD